MGASLSATPRLASVDALRGVTVAAMLLVNFPGDAEHVFGPLRHADWNGITAADVIFPTFLFISGVSISLAPVATASTRGELAQASRKILVRAARIIGLALFCALLVFFLSGQSSFRVWGVLQRIGLCYAAAAIISIYFKPKTQWGIAAFILIAYAALLHFGGGTSPLGNPVDRVDTALLGSMLYHYDPATGHGHDPEGLLSTFPAIATTIIGVRAGEWLKQGRLNILTAFGFGALAAGYAWSLLLPLNKNLWTPSFVILVAGISTLALAMAHYLVDQRGLPPLGRDFGRNAIVAYVGSGILAVTLLGLGVWPMYHQAFARLAPIAGAGAASLLFSISYVAVWALIVHVMGKLGWRVRL